jgi:isopentenyldiphosphate isomerase
MAQYPPLPIVDKNDQIVGEASLSDIYKQGFIHRVVLIILQDPDGRILLQRRSPDMATNANRWDVSAAGHVDAGEDYNSAAARELEEELGIKDIELKEIAYYFSDQVLEGKKLRRFMKIFSATMPGSTNFSINKEELSEVQWFEIDKLRELLKQQPQEFNNDLNEILDKTKDQLYENHSN